VSDGDLSRFDARQRKHRAEAESAWPAFLSGLPPEERRLLEKWSPDAEVSRTSAADHDAADDAHDFVDVAASADRPQDIIREIFHLSGDQAERVWAWHSAAVSRAEEGARSRQLKRIVGVLIRPMKDVSAVIIGLAMASGQVGDMSLNGYSSGAEAARKLGKHRATLSHWKRFWQDLLHLTDETYGKTKEAKEKYRAARLKVVARKQQKETL